MDDDAERWKGQRGAKRKIIKKACRTGLLVWKDVDESLFLHHRQFEYKLQKMWNESRNGLKFSEWILQYFEQQVFSYYYFTNNKF